MSPQTVGVEKEHAELLNWLTTIKIPHSIFYYYLYNIQAYTQMFTFNTSTHPHMSQNIHTAGCYACCTFYPSFLPTHSRPIHTPKTPNFYIFFSNHVVHIFLFETLRYPISYQPYRYKSMVMHTSLFYRVISKLLNNIFDINK